MSTPEFLGTTVICCADQATRTFYVWAFLSEMGEIEAVHYGITFELINASVAIGRRDLDSETRKAIWRFAEDAINEEDVIEPFEDLPTTPTGNILPFQRRH